MRITTIKRKVVLSAIGIAAIAGAGGAYAATQSNSDPRKAFLDDVAKRLHVTPSQVTSALQGAQIDQLNAAVAAGKISQAEADAIKKRIQQGGAGGPWPVPGPGGPGGFGFFHREGHFGPGGPVGGPLGGVAKYLGLSETELLNDLSSGKSLAQVAKAQGKSVSGLKATMVADIKSKLDKAVASKMLTQSQEQQMLSQISSHLDQEINETHQGIGPGGHGWAGPRGKPGMGERPRFFQFGSNSAPTPPVRAAGPVA